MMSIRNKDIRNFLLSKRPFNRQPLLFTHTTGYLNSRLVSFRRLLLVLAIDMGIINTYKSQDSQIQDCEMERKRIAKFEEAVKIGNEELKNNHDFYFKDKIDEFFYIKTKAFDRFITDILVPLMNMIKYN